jgi:hypothetical protein
LERTRLCTRALETRRAVIAIAPRLRLPECSPLRSVCPQLSIRIEVLNVKVHMF